MKDRIDFVSYDGQTTAMTAQGAKCVALMIRGKGGNAGVVLTPKEAKALGRSLIRRARYSKR